MKKRYKNALIVFAALLVITVAASLFVRLFFGGVSMADSNHRQPYDLELTLGEDLSVKNVIETVCYTPMWAKGEHVSVEVERIDGDDAEGILEFDEDSGRFFATGVGEGTITLTSEMDRKVFVKIDFRVDFASRNTRDWVKEELKDDFFTEEELQAVKQIVIDAGTTVDFKDLALFTGLESVVVNKTDAILKMQNADVIAPGVYFLVPGDMYRSYISDNAWRDYASRIFPNGGNDKNVVVLHLNGGTLSGQSASQDVYYAAIGESGKIAFDSYQITKRGYTFKGWGISTDEGASYSSTVNKDYTADGNVKAYAIWEENKYTIMYDVNLAGASASGLSPVTLRYSETGYITNSIPTKTGYTFLGWSTDPHASAMQYSSGQSVFGLSEEAGAAIMLYGVWDANKYSIKFYGTSTSDYEYTQSIAFDQTLRIRGVSGKMTGYSFVGWAVSATSNVIRYREGDSVKVADLVTAGEMSLYAVWEPVKYSISFYGGEITSGAPSPINDIVYGQTVSLPSQAPKRTGYTFLGWSLMASDTLSSHDSLPAGSYVAGAQVKNLTEINGDCIVFYPVWKADQFTIRFNVNGGSGSISNKTVKFGESVLLTGVSGVTRNNYVLAGWSVSSASNAAVEFVAEGFSAEQIATLYTKAGGANKQITLYAVWKAKYVVKYDANGGSSTPANQEAVVDKALTLASGITKTGYVLSGWSNGTQIFLPGEIAVNVGGATIKAGNSVTLKAEWKPVEYTVMFDLNGAGAFVAPISAKYDVAFALPAAPQREGYNFVGWQFGGQTYSAGASVSKLTVENGAVLTFSAVWQAK